MPVRAVMIKCPQTGREVPTGESIDADSWNTLRTPGSNTFRCPQCGQWHAWNKQNAYLGAEVRVRDDEDEYDE